MGCGAGRGGGRGAGGFDVQLSIATSRFLSITSNGKFFILNH